MKIMNNLNIYIMTLTYIKTKDERIYKRKREGTNKLISINR